MGSIPDPLDSETFVNSLMGAPFCLHHSFSTGETILYVEYKALQSLKRAIPGLNAFPLAKDFHACRCIVAYPMPSNERRDTDSEDANFQQPMFADMWRLLGGTSAALTFVFVPSNSKDVAHILKRIEKQLGALHKSETTSNVSRNGFLSNIGMTLQRESFQESDKRRLLESMMGSILDTVARESHAYKLFVLLDNDNDTMIKYLQEKMAVLEDIKINVESMEDALGLCFRANAFPLSHQTCAKMLEFSGSVERKVPIHTTLPRTTGNVLIGNLMDEGLTLSEKMVFMPETCFNLSTIISGMPGSGKTALAMSLMEQARSRAQMPSLIISPTNEWNDFAGKNRYRIVRIGADDTKINFFRVIGKNTERFYQNLAMLIACATNAGPYKNSIEKCLLSAFQKAYAISPTPDPVELYSTIESAIIEQHGSLSGMTVKYTKHGENIRSALQSLRIILSTPEYAFVNGVKVEELFGKGVIVDLSEVSNAMKPMYYALILNQAYASCEDYDVFGNSSLRFLLCLEEAQLVFGSGEGNESAAVVDITQRIQDFRKKGIGLILVTHNIVDLEPGIRRLCQNKFYFRQSSDISSKASSDLGFSENVEGQASLKLRELPHRICAANVMQDTPSGRSPTGPFFIKTRDYALARSPSAECSQRQGRIAMQIMITIGNIAASSAKVALEYLSEKVEWGITDSKGKITFRNVILDRPYALYIFGEKKRDTRRIQFSSSAFVSLKL